MWTLQCLARVFLPGLPQGQRPTARGLETLHRVWMPGAGGAWGWGGPAFSGLRGAGGAKGGTSGRDSRRFRSWLHGPDCETHGGTLSSLSSRNAPAAACSP